MTWGQWGPRPKAPNAKTTGGPLRPQWIPPPLTKLWSLSFGAYVQLSCAGVRSLVTACQEKMMHQKEFIIRMQSKSSQLGVPLQGGDSPVLPTPATYLCIHTRALVMLQQTAPAVRKSLVLVTRGRLLSGTDTGLGPGQGVLVRGSGFLRRQ
ncbi:hypothetical protein BU15DRAFT_69462 [Melanogaster broomeanus]|nr:hypothetical protein BU15DRAFT_69462 [Melanogaster broomeanus]